jgi:hypothetical protein
MSKIILSKSKRKGKRLKVEMIGFEGMIDNSDHFGSDVGQTFIDHKDLKKKSGWVARHSVNKSWNDIHSPLYYSKSIFWNTPDFKKNIRLLAKKLDTTIINRL